MTTKYVLNFANNSTFTLSFVESKGYLAADSSFFPLIWLIYVVELIALLFIIICIIPLIRSFSKISLLHSNLKRLFLYYMYHEVVYCCMRVVTFIYQNRWLPVTGTWYCDLPFLIAHLIRLYHVYVVYCTVSIFVVERLAATLLVKDYDSKSYSTVSIGLIVYSTAISLSMPYLSGHLTSMGNIIGIAFLAVEVIVSVIIFLSIWMYNKRLLVRYSTRDTIPSRNTFGNYTLGKKYQIKENLRAFRFILFVLISGCSSCAIALPLATISSQSDPLTQVFLRAIVDLVSTFSFIFSALAGLYAHDEWRYKLIELLPIRKIRKETRSMDVHSSSPPSKTDGEEGEVYFNHLRSAWE